MCRTIRMTVYTRSSKDGLIERLRLLDGGVGTFEGDFACGRKRVWHLWYNAVDVGIAGWSETRFIGTLLDITVFVYCDGVRLNTDNWKGPKHAALQ